MTDDDQPTVLKFVKERIVDGILDYWRGGFHDEFMREWWTTDDAVDCAGELAQVVIDALGDAGFVIAEDTP